MNRLIEEAILLLAKYGWQEVVPVLILAALRPLGLFYGFIGFTWTLGTGRLVRVVLAISVGLPMVLFSLPTVAELVEHPSITRLTFLAFAEVTLGLGFGLIASLPFFALQYAGAITDQFRGESDSGLQAPTGGTITTFGLLYLVIGLFAFAYLDGIGLLIRSLFRSYLIWPLAAPFPDVTGATVTLIMQVFTDSLLLAIQLALPLLALLYIVELSMMIAARIAKRFNFYNFSFPVKNAVAIGFLPLLAAYAWLFSNLNIGPFFQNFDFKVFLEQ